MNSKLDDLGNAYLEAEANNWKTTQKYDKALAAVTIDKPTFVAIANTFVDNPGSGNFRVMLGAMLAWQHSQFAQDQD